MSPAARLGPCPAVGMQGTVLVTDTLWNKCVFKRALSAVWWQKDS